MPKGQRIKIFLTGVKPNWPRLNSFCLIAGIKTGSKKSIWIFKLYYSPSKKSKSNSFTSYVDFI
jgi:hypothetical protein